MPRYVLLRHETPPGYERPTHYDLMLEADGVLRTWALVEPPAPGRLIAAEQLANHRLAYLDYEGPISGNRGAVTRWDAGSYTLVSESPERLEVLLAGERLRGVLVLEKQLAPDSWHVSFTPTAD